MEGKMLFLEVRCQETKLLMWKMHAPYLLNIEPFSQQARVWEISPHETRLGLKKKKKKTAEENEHLDLAGGSKCCVSRWSLAGVSLESLHVCTT